ncbi:hypothetical protein DWT44_01695 [Campylobacter coli]|nr:hypothetical protein [Campylobacter coli]EAH5502126.1 hypothetical protein [Campylobacter coli]EAH6405905.1 hypothetical protein [Campylobacter coli]EAI4050798.1 hypothetical protein [Campylobacter coli]EAI5038266.1 hypothetical protein [Campylobacter coli]
MQVVLKKLEVNQTQTLLNRNKIMLKYFVSILNKEKNNETFYFWWFIRFRCFGFFSRLWR